MHGPQHPGTPLPSLGTVGMPFPHKKFALNLQRNYLASRPKNKFHKEDRGAYENTEIVKARAPAHLHLSCSCKVQVPGTSSSLSRVSRGPSDQRAKDGGQTECKEI